MREGVREGFSEPSQKETNSDSVSTEPRESVCFGPWEPGSRVGQGSRTLELQPKSVTRPSGHPCKQAPNVLHPIFQQAS
jgi:hypothetical protein